MACGGCWSPIRCCWPTPDVIRRCRPLLGTFVEVTAQMLRPHRCGFRGGRAGSRADERARSGERAQPNQSSCASRAARGQRRDGRGPRPSRCIGGGSAAGCSTSSRRGSDRSRKEGFAPSGPAASAGQQLGVFSTVEGRTVRLTAPACIDLGGIAKGYAVDQAVAAMRRLGAGRGLVNAGGDMFGFGPQAWMVAVIDPTTHSRRSKWLCATTRLRPAHASTARARTCRATPFGAR